MIETAVGQTTAPQSLEVKVHWEFVAIVSQQLRAPNWLLEQNPAEKVEKWRRRS